MQEASARYQLFITDLFSDDDAISATYGDDIAILVWHENPIEASEFCILIQLWTQKW